MRASLWWKSFLRCAGAMCALSFATIACAGDPQPPRLGLVLSGGGAKGFAHIGVLKVLE